MLKSRTKHISAALLFTAVALAVIESPAHGQASKAAAAQKVPTFKVDPSWPQELPHNWIMAVVTGVFVDAKQNVWVTQLPEQLTEEETFADQKPPMSTCCSAPPTVMEFDPQGKVIQAWGTGSKEPPADWPRNPHGIFVDHNDFVWIGTYMHHRVQKYTRDGKLLMTIGTYDKTGGSNDTTLLGGPAGIWVDPKTNEVYIADGYRNRRVIVFDGATGKYLRHWGAYGERPDDTEKFDPKTMVNGALPKQFSTVHGITGSKDGKLYVADRRGNRIQVFTHEGKFLMEKIIAPATLASGSAFVPVLSPDAQQTWLYVADGTNHKVWILRRSDMEIVGSFGHGGHQVGEMIRPHGMSVDSQGNLYVGEASYGRRIQKFTLQK